MACSHRRCGAGLLPIVPRTTMVRTIWMTTQGSARLELAATVVRVGRVGAAKRWLAHASPNSLRHVSLGGHGNGTRIMWGR